MSSQNTVNLLGIVAMEVLYFTSDFHCKPMKAYSVFCIPEDERKISFIAWWRRRLLSLTSLNPPCPCLTSGPQLRGSGPVGNTPLSQHLTAFTITGRGVRNDPPPPVYYHPQEGSGMGCVVNQGVVHTHRSTQACWVCVQTPEGIMGYCIVCRSFLKKNVFPTERT